MMERRRKLQQQGGTPNDVVALCKAYSERLKVREERGRGERHAARRSRFATKLPSVFGALFLSFVPHVQQNMLIGCRSFRHQKKTNTPRTRTHTRSCVRFPRVSPHLLGLAACSGAVVSVVASRPSAASWVTCLVFLSVVVCLAISPPRPTGLGKNVDFFQHQHSNPPTIVCQ